jgi:hypothetical protein
VASRPDRAPREPQLHQSLAERCSEARPVAAYHGAFSVSRHTKEGALYLRAVAHAEQEHDGHASIVNGSIAAALDGKFGDVQFSRRTAESELYVNPLMGMYFTFDLMGLCRRNQYLRQLVDAPSVVHVEAIISDHHAHAHRRPHRLIPH